jgi:hypothetical protein
MIKMRVTGVKELQAKFERIKLDMADTYAAALVAGAYPVINATKNGAPYKSGTLRRSYHIGTKSRDITKPQAADGMPQPVSRGGVAVVADGLRRGRTVEVLVGTDVEYAPPQEFLHKPHLRPALEANRGEVRAEVRRAIQMMIKKATT